MLSQPVPKRISATEASNNFGSMIDEAAQGRSLFIVTRMGHPRAIVLGVEQYRELLEELEITQELNDPEVIAALEEAREDIRLGRTVTLEEFRKEFGFADEEPSDND